MKRAAAGAAAPPGLQPAPGSPGSVSHPIPYRPPWWLPAAHAQTVVPARLLPLPEIAYRRERWNTPDGDFIDLDRVDSESLDPTCPLLVLFHGLEGNSQSHYARLLMAAARQRAWRGVVVHFRGCSGVPNRLARAYHSGDSAEIDWVLRRMAELWPAARRFAVGISLGGNVLAKWAGECPQAAERLLVAAVVVCAPFDLAASAWALERGVNRAYTHSFLASLRPKALAKLRRYPGLADATAIAASRSLREFDDAFTAPVHGFAGVADYWSRASAKPWLRRVTLPLLALNARNDPFVPAQSLPLASEVSACVTLECPAGGGHVGFYSGLPGRDPWFLRERVCQFLASFLSTQARA